LLGSTPNIVYQICQSPGHYSASCAVRYQSKHISHLPALATFLPNEAVKSLWNSNSAMVTHMTPEEGNLSSMNPYLGSRKVEVRNASLLPVANIGSLRIQIHSKPLPLNSVLHTSQLKA